MSEKLEDLHTRWDELETTTQAKARSLFDANRAELFAQSCSALESWLLSLQAQLHSDDYGKDLTSVNILLKKQQVRRPWLGTVNEQEGGRGLLQLLRAGRPFPALADDIFTGVSQSDFRVRRSRVRRQKSHSLQRGNFSKKKC